VTDGPESSGRSPGSTGRGVAAVVGTVGPRSTGGGQGVESAEAVEDQAGERRRSSQVQPGAPAGGCETSGDREQPMAEALGFPAAGRMVGEGEGLHPGDQIAGQGDDRAPDLVGVEVVQRQVGKPTVLGAADAVLGPCPAAVPQLEIGQLPLRRVGG
jgi:hypothetical protein